MQPQGTTIQGWHYNAIVCQDSTSNLEHCNYSAFVFRPASFTRRENFPFKTDMALPDDKKHVKTVHAGSFHFSESRCCLILHPHHEGRSLMTFSAPLPVRMIMTLPRSAPTRRVLSSRLPRSQPLNRSQSSICLRLFEPVCVCLSASICVCGQTSFCAASYSPVTGSLVLPTNDQPAGLHPMGHFHPFRSTSHGLGLLPARGPMIEVLVDLW